MAKAAPAPGVKPTLPAVEDSSAPTKPGYIRLFNKGTRQFSHTVKNEDGSSTEFIGAPKMFVSVPKEVADIWLGYPDDFITNDEANKSLDASAKLLDEANAKAVTLEQEKASLADELKAAKAELDALKAAQNK